jgi:hypothetical protein
MTSSVAGAFANGAWSQITLPRARLGWRQCPLQQRYRTDTATPQERYGNATAVRAIYTIALEVLLKRAFGKGLTGIFLDGLRRASRWRPRTARTF